MRDFLACKLSSENAKVKEKRDDGNLENDVGGIEDKTVTAPPNCCLRFRPMKGDISETHNVALPLDPVRQKHLHDFGSPYSELRARRNKAEGRKTSLVKKVDRAEDSASKQISFGAEDKSPKILGPSLRGSMRLPASGPF